VRRGNDSRFTSECRSGDQHASLGAVYLDRTDEALDFRRPDLVVETVTLALHHDASSPGVEAHQVSTTITGTANVSYAAIAGSREDNSDGFFEVSGRQAEQFVQRLSICKEPPLTRLLSLLSCLRGPKGRLLFTPTAPDPDDYDNRCRRGWH
jgi:hypothetical protein